MHIHIYIYIYIYIYTYQGCRNTVQHGSYEPVLIHINLTRDVFDAIMPNLNQYSLEMNNSQLNSHRFQAHILMKLTGSCRFLSKSNRFLPVFIR